MGGSIDFTGLAENGAPFVGAAGGVSVQTPGGLVVLGNDLGISPPAQPARISTPREINMQGQYILLSSYNLGATLDWAIYLGDQNVSLGFFQKEGIIVQANSSFAWAGVLGFLDPSQVAGSKAMFFQFSSGVMELRNDLNNIKVQFRDFVTETITVNGGVSQYLPVVDKAASFNMSAVGGPRTLVTNRGAAASITFTLDRNIVGYEFTFHVVAGFSIVIQAQAGVTLRNAALLTAAGGTLTGAAVGSSIRMVCLSATSWAAVAVVGAWV